MTDLRVLVVEDERDIRKHLVRALEREGMTVEQAEDGRSGLVAFERSLPPVVLLDLKMPGMGGMEVLERIHALRPETRVVILTGHGEKSDAVKALNLHATAWLEKPPDLDQVIEAVRSAWAGYAESVGAPEPNVQSAEPPPGLEAVRKALGGALTRGRDGCGGS